MTIGFVPLCVNFDDSLTLRNMGTRVALVVEGLPDLASSPLCSYLTYCRYTDQQQRPCEPDKETFVTLRIELE